jgi:AAA+ superfamily predicted ATPase
MEAGLPKIMNINGPTRLELHLRAGSPLVFVDTSEETRLFLMLQEQAGVLGRRFYTWTCALGLQEHRTGTGPVNVTQPLSTVDNPLHLIEAFNRLSQDVVLLACDLASWLRPNRAGPPLVRRLREAVRGAKCMRRTLVVSGPDIHVPVELVKEAEVLDFGLPSPAVLDLVLANVCRSAITAMSHDEIQECVAAAAGLTVMEAEAVFALAYAKEGLFLPETIRQEKVRTIRQHGLLDVVEPGTTLADVGGLDNLKEHLAGLAGLFGEEARKYRVEPPPGLLLVGQPGTGKSLVSQAAMAALKLPALRLESGRLFGSLVGESERNWRKAFETVRAMAPCVFVVEEVDGLFAGGRGQDTNGGTTQRVLKAILQDIQLHGRGVFFLFTANDPGNLPSPLVDRLPLWEVDLPGPESRRKIWRLQITRSGRDPRGHNLDGYANWSRGWSGRQIWQAWQEVLVRAFNDGRREPSDQDVLAVAAQVVPIAVSQKEEIEARRKQLAGRARPASRERTDALDALFLGN